MSLTRYGQSSVTVSSTSMYSANPRSCTVFKTHSWLNLWMWNLDTDRQLGIWAPADFVILRGFRYAPHRYKGTLYIQNTIMSVANHYKKVLMRSYTFCLYQVFKIQSQLGLDGFRILNSHMWLVQSAAMNVHREGTYNLWGPFQLRVSESVGGTAVVKLFPSWKPSVAF